MGYGEKFWVGKGDYEEVGRYAYNNHLNGGYMLKFKNIKLQGISK